MEILVELSQILINETISQQIVVLKEKDGERSFPIVIGLPEVIAIDRRLKGEMLPRPMTHDLLAGVIEQMGGAIVKVVINDLQDHTFYARIHIRTGGGIVEVDSRPSDAIALTAGMEVPLFVDERVFDQLRL
jgi:bifunctional DNase/RNase